MSQPRQTNRALIPKLKAVVVTDAKSEFMRVRLSLAVFGYSSISKQFVIDHKIDMAEVAEDYGWSVTENFLSYGIEPEESKSLVGAVFGEAMPTRKQVEERTKKRIT